MIRRDELGKEVICHTCVFGIGGHGELLCKADGNPVMSRGMTNMVVCSEYMDILTAETKPERPIKGDKDD